MSTYVLMRILESAPRRYELGICLLTFGRLEGAYERLADRIEPGHRVLDVGCGTGALALCAARRGATVRAIDVNSEMLEVAARRCREAGLEDHVDLAEMGVAELDREATEGFDAVMSGLCFSELTEDELTYALRQVARILRPGGLLLVADEVEPRSLAGRLLYRLIRAPLAALAYVITQQTTRPVVNLPEKLAAAGLAVESVKSSLLGSLGEFVARKAVAVPS